MDAHRQPAGTNQDWLNPLVAGRKDHDTPDSLTKGPLLNKLISLDNRIRIPRLNYVLYKVNQNCYFGQVTWYVPSRADTFFLGRGEGGSQSTPVF